MIAPFTLNQIKQMSLTSKAAARDEPMDLAKAVLPVIQPAQPAPLGPRPPGYVDLDLGAELLTQSLDPQVLKLGRRYLEQFAGAFKIVQKKVQNRHNGANKARRSGGNTGSGAETLTVVPIQRLPGPAWGNFYVKHADVLKVQQDFTWFVRGLLPSRQTKRSGRPKGSTIEGDAALYAEAEEMKRNGMATSARGAARILAPYAKGTSSLENRIERLRHKFSPIFGDAGE